MGTLQMEGALTILTNQFEQVKKVPNIEHLHFKGLRDEIKKLTLLGMDLHYFKVAHDEVSKIDEMLGIKDNHYSSYFVNNRRSGNIGYYYYKHKLPDSIDISDEILNEYAGEDLLDWVINPKNNED